MGPGLSIGSGIFIFRNKFSAGSFFVGKDMVYSQVNENHTGMPRPFPDCARPLIRAELTPAYVAGLPGHIIPCEG